MISKVLASSKIFTILQIKGHRLDIIKEKKKKKPCDRIWLKSPGTKEHSPRYLEVSSEDSQGEFHGTPVPWSKTLGTHILHSTCQYI